MANLSIRVADDLLARFDAAAGSQGGRAPTLRRLMDQAAAAAPAPVGRLPTRPLKLTVRLGEDDGAGLAREATAMGMTRKAMLRSAKDNPIKSSGTMPTSQGAETTDFSAVVATISTAMAASRTNQ